MSDRIAQANESRRFASGTGRADCTALVVTYNSASDIAGLLESLRQSDDALTLRIVVVDNDSTDGTPDAVAAHDDVLLVHAGANLGYAGAINLGLRRAGDSDAYLVLNPDVVLAPVALRQLWEAARQPGVGASVPAIRNADGSVYESLRREPSLTRTAGDIVRLGLRLPAAAWASETVHDPAAYAEPHSIDWATGAVMMINSASASRVGDWDERFFLYSEETDYARRIRDCGFVIRYVPTAEATHRIGGSGGPSALAALLAVNKIRYYEKFHGRVGSAVFRLLLLTHYVIRARRGEDRTIARTIARPSSWAQLPKASR